MIVRRSALVDRSAEQLFDLIEAAEHYPAFLPWCRGAEIVMRDAQWVSADLHVRFAGVDFTMRTRNPKQRPVHMAIHLERGPFRRFEGEWQLTPLTPGACKVAFVLDWEFDSAVMTRLAGPVFGRAADTLVDAFVQRALAMSPAPAAVAQAADPAAHGTAPAERCSAPPVPAPSLAPAATAVPPSPPLNPP